MTDKIITMPAEPDVKLIRARNSEYVEKKDGCQEHGYVGQGWPSSVKLAGLADKEDDVIGCLSCYRVWRETHINPDTERAGA